MEMNLLGRFPQGWGLSSTIEVLFMRLNNNKKKKKKKMKKKKKKCGRVWVRFRFNVDGIAVSPKSTWTGLP
jgi:hypothetical protein